MKRIILAAVFLLYAFTLNSQEQKEILEFNAFGTFNPKDSESKKEQNCRGGFNNHISILFHSEYRLIGTYPNLRIASIQKDSNIEVFESGEIKYDSKTGLCSSKMKLGVPKSPVYSLVNSKKDNAFVDSDSAVFSYNKKLDKESLYLSLLSCFNSKDSFLELIKAAVGKDSEEMSARINYSFPSGTVYSKCEIIENLNCSCRISFSKRGLKEQISLQFQK